MVQFVYTCSLPLYQTASGAVDMMAHIMERYFTNTKYVALTDRLAEGLMKTIIAAATRALEEPLDYNARADLMWAGMLAHNNSVGLDEHRIGPAIRWSMSCLRFMIAHTGRGWQLFCRRG